MVVPLSPGYSLTLRSLLVNFSYLSTNLLSSFLGHFFVRTFSAMTPFVVHSEKLIHFPGLLNGKVQLHHFLNILECLRPSCHEYSTYVNRHHELQFPPSYFLYKLQESAWILVMLHFLIKYLSNSL